MLDPDQLLVLAQSTSNKLEIESRRFHPVFAQYAPSIAEFAAEVNRTVENIGARRLHTVLERVFEELSYEAPDRGGQSVTIDRAYVEARVGALAHSADMSRYVL